MTKKQNQLSSVKKTIKLARDLFELHPETITKCGECGQEKKREAFYSFTLDAIKGKSDIYVRLSDMIHDLAVGEDYAYNWIVNAIDAIDGMTEDNATPDDLADIDLHEAIDSTVSIYTSDLTDWLGSSAYNAEYLTDAIKEYGAPDNGINLLQQAQYKAIEEVFYQVRDILEDKAEELYKDEASEAGNQ